MPGARLVPWQGSAAGRSRCGNAGPGGAGNLVADFLVIAVGGQLRGVPHQFPKENIYSAHEIGPVLALGAALGGRVAGSLVAARLGYGAQRGAAAHGTPPRSVRGASCSPPSPPGLPATP